MDNNYQYLNSQTTYIPSEQSYIENILRLNKGKRVYIYQSFNDNCEWKNKIFNGILEQCGKDHIIISNPSTGSWDMLLMKYVDFIEFDEEVNTVNQFYSSNH